jgi:hypothetical protein
MKSRKYKRGGKKNITLKWPLSQSSREKLMKEYRGGDMTEYEVYSKESFQTKLMEHISKNEMAGFNTLITGMEYEEGVVTIGIIEKAIEVVGNDYFDKLLKMGDAKQFILETCKGNNSLWIKALTVNNQGAFKALCDIAEIPINFTGPDGKSILRLICEQPENSKEFLKILLGFKGIFNYDKDKDKESKLNLLNVGLYGVKYRGYMGGPYNETYKTRILKTYTPTIIIDHDVDNKHNIKLILTLCLIGLTGVDNNDSFKKKLLEINAKYSDYIVKGIELLECLLACSMYGLLEWVKKISVILKEQINSTVNAPSNGEYAWEHGQYYYNCLHLACINGHVDIVTYLLSRSDINVNAFLKSDEVKPGKYIDMNNNNKLVENQNALRVSIDSELKALKNWKLMPVKTTVAPTVQKWMNVVTPLLSVAIIPSKDRTDNHYTIIKLLLSHKDINDLQCFDIGIMFGFLTSESTIINKIMTSEIDKETSKKLLFKYNNRQDGVEIVFNALQWSIFKITESYPYSADYENVARVLMSVYNKNNIKFKEKDKDLEGLEGLNGRGERNCKKTPLYLASENSNVPEDILIELIENITGNNGSTANEKHIEKTIMDNLVTNHSEKGGVIALLKSKGGVLFRNLTIVQLDEAAGTAADIPDAVRRRLAEAGGAAARRAADAAVAAGRSVSGAAATAARKALSMVTGPRTGAQ